MQQRQQAELTADLGNAPLEVQDELLLREERLVVGNLPDACRTRLLRVELEPHELLVDGAVEALEETAKGDDVRVALW